MCVYVCVYTRVIHKHSFLSRFLFIDLLPPTPSFNPTLFIRLRPSVNSCLSLSLFLLFFPLHLFFIFSQRLSKRLFRVMHRFLATIPSRVSVLPLLSNLPRALLASLAFTLLD